MVYHSNLYEFISLIAFEQVSQIVLQAISNATKIDKMPNFFVRSFIYMLNMLQYAYNKLPIEIIRKENVTS